MNKLIKRLLFIVLIISTTNCFSQSETQILSFSDTGDFSMCLGRYKIGTSIQILCQITGGWAEHGGIYHLAGLWNDLPKITYRNESKINQRLTFYGYKDGTGTAYLFAHWDNQSPSESYSNTLKFTISSSGDFDTSLQGDYALATPLKSLLAIQSYDESVCIGTLNPGSHKLAVKGSIKATEVVVESDWADFVFGENYDLPNLSKVKEFIDTNQHLPGIPSAQEVKDNGVSVGEMNKLLLQKIEELTLYAIDKENQVKKLQAQIEKQESQSKTMQKRLAKIEAMLKGVACSSNP